MGEKIRLYPLKNVILRIVAISMAVVFILCMATMAMEYRVLVNMKNTIEKNDIFAHFYETGEELNTALSDYFHTNQAAKREVCLEQKEKLETVSQEMRDAFLDPQFQDNYYLTGSCLEIVEELLQTSQSLLSEEQMKYYEEYEKVYGYIKENKNILNSVRADLISKACNRQFEAWRKQFFAIVLLVAATGFYLFAFSRRMIQDILRPIMILTEQARSFQNGNHMEAKMPEARIGITETAILTETFLEMAKTIEKQMRQLKDKIDLDRKLHQLEIQNMQMQMSLTETKMQLIQSMISPHFLFNCLNTLSSLAYFEKASKTREASQKIARYLRDCLGFVGQKVKICEEVIHTQHYIEIQQMRFGDRIQFSIACDEACESFQVPAMILQPLVENSISHGLKDLWQDGQVCVEIEDSEEAVCLKVEDNGEGMEEERLREIREEIAQPFEPGRHTIGLHGVASRIKMFFGERATIQINSISGQGTQVVIAIKKSPAHDET